MGTDGDRSVAAALERVSQVQGAAERLEERRWLTLEGKVSGRVRAEGRHIIMLGSNDYLGLSSHPRVVERSQRALRDHGAGTGMNPVLSLTSVHRDLMRAMRAFTGCEQVLLFNSCTAANCALIPTIIGEDDVIISDEFNHASIVDACRLSRGRTLVYKHGDLTALESALQQAERSSTRLVVTDGVFSMEGVPAPLREILRATRRHGALLAVDESHAAGVLGPTGKGTREFFGISPDEFIQTGTFSKSFGAGIGGYVAGPRDLIAYLVQEARFFIFTSGMPPSAAGAALGALEVMSDEPEVLQRLTRNSQRMRNGLRSMGLTVAGREGPILPVLIGKNDTANQLSSLLMEAGVYAPAFSYPIVPNGTARLRLQVSAAHTDKELDFVLDSLNRLTKKIDLDVHDVIPDP